MYYHRKTYLIKPEFLDPLNELFETLNLPNRLKHGAHLVGRWSSEINEECVEVFAIWQYPSEEAFVQINNRIKNDKSHQDKLKAWFEAHGGKATVLKTFVSSISECEIKSTQK